VEFIFSAFEYKDGGICDADVTGTVRMKQ